MPDTLLQKAERYRQLHARPGAFVAGGCWDPGSAMMLAHAGLEVLETSSAGVMFACGLPDGDGLATRDLMLENARSIAAAVRIPVTADLENGFGNDPEVVVETIRLAGETEIVGGSIEDTTGDRSDPILPLGLAVDRIRAAAEAAPTWSSCLDLPGGTRSKLCAARSIARSRLSSDYQHIGRPSRPLERSASGGSLSGVLWHASHIPDC